MMKSLFVIAVLLFATTLTAQVSTGNIYGKITDSEGNSLPGVTSSCAGTAARCRALAEKRYGLEAGVTAYHELYRALALP